MENRNVNTAQSEMKYFSKNALCFSLLQSLLSHMIEVAQESLSAALPSAEFQFFTEFSLLRMVKTREIHRRSVFVTG